MSTPSPDTLDRNCELQVLMQLAELAAEGVNVRDFANFNPVPDPRRRQLSQEQWDRFRPRDSPGDGARDGPVRPAPRPQPPRGPQQGIRVGSRQSSSGSASNAVAAGAQPSNTSSSQPLTRRGRVLNGPGMPSEDTPLTRRGRVLNGPGMPPEDTPPIRHRRLSSVARLPPNPPPRRLPLDGAGFVPPSPTQREELRRRIELEQQVRTEKRHWELTKRMQDLEMENSKDMG